VLSALKPPADSRNITRVSRSRSWSSATRIFILELIPSHTGCLEGYLPITAILWRRYFSLVLRITHKANNFARKSLKRVNCGGFIHPKGWKFAKGLENRQPLPFLHRCHLGWSKRGASVKSRLSRMARFLNIVQISFLCVCFGTINSSAQFRPPSTLRRRTNIWQAVLPVCVGDFRVEPRFGQARRRLKVNITEF
jgi:hypothetical protein